MKKKAKISDPILQVTERFMCANSYLTYEHSTITRNQEILDKKLDRIIFMLSEIK